MNERTTKSASFAPEPKRKPEPEEKPAVTRLASAIGNRAFATLARAGTGILTEGTAHPHVVEAVAKMRGRGERPVLPSSPAGRPVLARYDTGEHAQMGSDREIVVNGVIMTEAEAIALGGDLYESPEKMREAPVAELAHLLELVRRDKRAYLADAARVSRPGDEHVSNAEWEEATSGPGREGRSYLDLAKANATHFAPSATGPGGPDHKAEWWRIHKQALDKAHTATSSGDPLYNEALTDNAFAAHFLTDAFSAGHMVAKGDIMERAKAAWDRQKIVDGWIFKETNFTRGVAKRVLDDPKAGPKLLKYDLRLIFWDRIDVERFSEFLWQMADDNEAKVEFFNNFVKIVHDALNQGITVGEGLDVENFNGEHWKLSGDDTLELSPETLRIARAAVEESFANVADAASTKGGLAYDYYFAKVWDYTPKPTAEGRERIHDVLDTMLQPERRECQEAFALVITNNIDTIIEKLVEKRRLRDHDEAMEAQYERDTDLGQAMAWP